MNESQEYLDNEIYEQKKLEALILSIFCKNMPISIRFLSLFKSKVLQKNISDKYLDKVKKDMIIYIQSSYTNPSDHETWISELMQYFLQNIGNNKKANKHIHYKDILDWNKNHMNELVKFENVLNSCR